MKESDRVESTLTQVHGGGPMVLLPMTSSRTDSNVRRVPYVEKYQAYTGIFQTPAERLQEAAEDTERREDSKEE